MAIAAFLASLADLARATWHEPDAGIWEGRDDDRHDVASKLMCWVALDRAVRLADTLGATEKVDRWKVVRDTIAATILEHAWDEDVGAFVGALCSDHLDGRCCSSRWSASCRPTTPG